MLVDLIPVRLALPPPLLKYSYHEYAEGLAEYSVELQ